MSEPRAPVVGDYVRNLGRVLRVEEIPPPPQPPPKTVYVVEQVLAQIEIHSASGVLIDKRSAYSDFYGEGTAVPEAAAQAAILADGLGAGVVVIVRRIVTEEHAIAGRGKNYYAPEFIALDHNKEGDQISDEIVWRSDA